MVSDHQPSDDRRSWAVLRGRRFRLSLVNTHRSSFSNVRDFPVPKRRWSRTASSAKIEVLSLQSEQEGKSWNSLLRSALISQRMS